jgi:hypothetical protein
LLLIASIGLIVATTFLGSMAFDYALTLAKNFKILYYFIASVIITVIFYGAIFFYVKFILPPVVGFATGGGSEENLLVTLIMKGLLGLFAIPIIGGILAALVSILGAI